MRAKFIYESVESYLEPKSDDEIINLMSNLSKRELDEKLLSYVYIKNPNICKLLIKADADVNAKTINGYTALHYASIIGSEQIVKILIEAVADINIKTIFGHTALNRAFIN